jgi:hypothetical protein
MTLPFNRGWDWEDLRLWARPPRCGTDAASSVTEEIYPRLILLGETALNVFRPFPSQGGVSAQRLTSQDGNYAFARLEPGGYTITAFRSGLIGEIYGMTSEGSLSPLNLRQEQSLDKVDFHLRTSPPIAEIPNEAIAAAYPQDLVDLGAVYGRFSADGTLLAIVTNGIGTGDPEQGLAL